MSPTSDPDPTEVTAALAWYDGTVKLNGLAWYYLHRIRYRTDVDLATGVDGAASVTGHHGEYEVTVRHAGAERVVAVTLERDRSVDVKLDVAGDFVINAGISDAWYNPDTDGQGFFVNVFPSIGELFVGWFTYDTERPPDDVTAVLGEPGHRWLTAQGPYDGAGAALTVSLTEGGAFDAADPPAITPPGGIGTLVVEFTDCRTGRVVYDIPALGLADEIPIQRIADDNVSLCEALAAD